MTVGDEQLQRDVVSAYLRRPPQAEEAAPKNGTVGRVEPVDDATLACCDDDLAETEGVAGERVGGAGRSLRNRWGKRRRIRTRSEPAGEGKDVRGEILYRALGIQ